MEHGTHEGRRLTTAVSASVLLLLAPAAARGDAASCSCSSGPQIEPRVIVLIDASGSIGPLWHETSAVVHTLEENARTQKVELAAHTFWSEGESLQLQFPKYSSVDPSQVPTLGRGTPIPAAIATAVKLLSDDSPSSALHVDHRLPSSCRPFWVAIVSDGSPRFGSADPADPHGRAPERWNELRAAINNASVSFVAQNGSVTRVPIPLRFLIPRSATSTSSRKPHVPSSRLTEYCPMRESQNNRLRCSTEFVDDPSHVGLLRELNETVDAAAAACDLSPPVLHLAPGPERSPRTVSITVSDRSAIRSLSYALGGKCTSVDPARLAHELQVPVNGAPGDRKLLRAFAVDAFGNCGEKELLLEWPALIATTTLSMPPSDASVCGQALAEGNVVSDVALPDGIVRIIAGAVELGSGEVRSGSFSVPINTRLVVDGPTIVSAEPSFVGSTINAVPATRRLVVGNSRARGSIEDVVAVGGRGAWHCSGVLVTPRHVLTAAHCIPASRVLFGDDITHASDVVPTVAAAIAPGGADLAILTLARAVHVPVRRLRGDPPSPQQPLELAHAGFGARNPNGTNDYGHKHFMRSPATSLSCMSSDCDPRFEFELTGDGGRDTCDGDSGGPVLERTRRPAGCPADEDPGQLLLDWRIAGVTSRAWTGARNRCGEGGVYTRVDPFRAWIEQITGLPTERSTQ